MLAAQATFPMLDSQYSVNFTGTVTSDPYLDEEKQRIICTLRLKSISDVNQHASVRLYLRSDSLPLEGIAYGQTLECFGHIWSPEDPTNPNEFNQKNWLKTLSVNGMAAAKLEDVRISPAEGGLGCLISQIRAGISERIDVLFPRNPDLVRAFVLGDRTGLADDLTEAFRESGIAHLICISGMHVSTLAMAVSLLLGAFLPRRTATVIAIALVFLYGALIGFPASMLRAAIMFTLFSLASLIGRPSDAVTRIAAALTGMLLIQPFYVLNAGFVLSFGATAGLILLDSPMKALLCVDRLQHCVPSSKWFGRMLQRALRYFPELLTTTLSAQIAILPAVVQYFGMQSLISVPANLLAVPLAMLAYPLAMAVLLISGLFLPVGRLLAKIPDGMFSLLTDIAGFLADHASDGLQVPNYPKWLILIHVVFCVMASDLTRIRLKVRKFIPMLIPALLGVSMLVGFVRALGFGVTFLDAGQADAAVLHSGGHVYLIDAGDSYTPAGDYVSANYVSLDAVFLSHPHQDHAGGLTRVLSQIRPGVIYLPEGWEDVTADEEVEEAMALAETMGIPVCVLHGGDRLNLAGGVTLEVTQSEKRDSDNDCSQLLAFTARNRTVLFTGDLSQKGEPEQMPAADILKVPHHGSGKSCSSEMLNQVNPEIAVISVGRNNTYGHPAEETLERLESADCAIFRTDSCGAVFVNVRFNGDISVKTFLDAEDIQ